jgi:hypothetical protein
MPTFIVEVHAGLRDRAETVCEGECDYALRHMPVGRHTHSELGGLAQLARAPALHAGGQRFESVILHKR